MKKILIICLLMLLVVSGLFAGALSTASSINNDGTTKFTIKAYKSSPGQDNPVILSVYDALTGTLGEVGGLDEQGNSLDEALGDSTGKFDHIDIYPYLDKFLHQISGSAIDFPEDKNHVLFSYLVSGSNTGTYTLSITINPFKNAEGASIDAYYRLSNINYLFPASHSTTSKNKDVIKDDAPVNPQKGEPVYTPGSGNMLKKWTVTRSDRATGNTETWVAEGVINLIVSKSSYENASAGNYNALVKIKLTIS